MHFDQILELRFKSNSLIFSTLLSFGLLTSACGEDETPPALRPAVEQSDSACSSTSLSLTALYDCQGTQLNDAQVESDNVGWLVLESRYASHREWNGVGRYGNCTGTLLNVGGSGNDPAYVITNAHCVGPNAGELLASTGVFYDLEERASNQMLFNYYVSRTNSEVITVDPKIIKFASMDQTDVAIVEMSVSYQSLIDQGINSYSLAASDPTVGTEVALVGVPQSGIRSSLLGLRKADCQVGQQVALWEGDFRFNYSFRHRCSIVGGSSGSSLINLNSKAIVAVNNTTVNDSALSQEDCTLNKPCEVDQSGQKTSNLDENYAQPAAFLSGCFANGLFDRTLSNCQSGAYDSTASN